MAELTQKQWLRIFDLARSSPAVAALRSAYEEQGREINSLKAALAEQKLITASYVTDVGVLTRELERLKAEKKREFDIATGYHARWQQAEAKLAEADEKLKAQWETILEIGTTRRDVEAREAKLRGALDQIEAHPELSGETLAGMARAALAASPEPAPPVVEIRPGDLARVFESGVCGLADCPACGSPVRKRELRDDQAPPEEKP